MANLDEQALRRPDFVEGAPVVLADGQSWHFRRPVMRFVPADNDTGFDVRVRLGDDGAYARLMRDLTDRAGFAPALAAARHLLLANYDLTAEQVADLIQFADEGNEDADPEGVRITEEVMAVVWGRGPKPSAGGGG